LKNVIKQMPGFEIAEARSSRDRNTFLTTTISSGGKTIIEGPPFNYYNFQGEPIPVCISREVFEAVKGN